MTEPRSYRVDVQADSTGTWATNGIRLPTREQAEAYGQDLMMRWTAVREMRVSECSIDPVNYDWSVTAGLIARG